MSCFAVGDGALTYVLHWNGKTWSRMRSPNLGPVQGITLNAVSCPTTTSCQAVGSYEDSEIRGLIEQWNGHAWRLVQGPVRAGSTTTVLFGVGCTTARSCIAVGYAYVPVSYTLAEAKYWNGSKWREMSVPSVSGSFLTTLTGIDCPTARSCFAVGYYDRGGQRVAIIAHWNGDSWRILSSRYIASSQLQAASCGTASGCIAVGDVEVTENHNPVDKTFAERYR
jgi:hypothetical protein